MTKILKEYNECLEKIKEFQPLIDKSKASIADVMPIELMDELLDFVGTDFISLVKGELEVSWKRKQ